MKRLTLFVLMLVKSISVFSQCTLTATVSSPTFVGGYNIPCNGLFNGIATANPSGGTSPYNYHWSNTQTTQTTTGLSAGTYTVTVTDANSCTVLSSITLTQPPQLLIVNAVSSPASCSTCSDGSVSASVTGTINVPYSVVWTPGFCDSLACTGLLPGTYTVCVTNANNCSRCDSVIVTFPTSIFSTFTQQTLEIYPNPASAIFTIKTSSPKPYNIFLFDLPGKLISNQTHLSNETLIDISVLPAGIYLLKITGEDGLNGFAKVVKQ